MGRTYLRIRFLASKFSSCFAGDRAWLTGGAGKCLSAHQSKNWAEAPGHGDDDQQRETECRFIVEQVIVQQPDGSGADPDADQGTGLPGEGEEVESDQLYDQAIALVARERKCSTSFIQRYLQIGYNRAARIVERMEREGVVSSANHVGKREVLARDIDDRER